MRIAREISPTDIYHILLSVVPNEFLFCEKDDYEKFKGIIEIVKEEYKFDLFGFCLMQDHVHLLLRVNDGTIGEIIKKISVSYSVWYNRKYDRRGTLYKDRYKSEIVEDDEKLLSILRFIHKNPIDYENYYYSSYRDYLLDEESLTDKSLVLEFVTLKEFIKFTSKNVEEEFLEQKPILMSIRKAERFFNDICKDLPEFSKCNEEQKKEIVEKCINFGLSFRQLSILCNVSTYYIKKYL